MSNTNLNSNQNSSKSLKDQQGVNVQVILRCRPVNTQEIKQRVPFVISCNESTQEVSLQQANRLTQLQQKTYHFDKVFGPKASQETIYNEALIPMVNEVLDGFNCTIFAYGQTGTGKTYTMEGNTSFPEYNEDMEMHAGVIPRAIQHIFKVLESMQGADYNVKVSHMEIYNEELTDLLSANLEKGSQAKIRILEDKQGVVVQGIEDVVVRNSMEIFEVLKKGSAQRTTAETLLNKQSSRSHSIFTVTINMKESTKQDSDDVIKTGKLNLVDLAGSENISRSGARDGRFREAASINQSLLTLGRVITALTEHSGHIPYRDSKLTRLLRDSLGGRTKTCIIATIAPTSVCLEETVNTLDYAHRAKNIRNKPEINQRIAKGALIKELSDEIEKLRGDLVATREKNGVYLHPERLRKLEEEHSLFYVRVQELESVTQVESDRSRAQLKTQEALIKQQQEQLSKVQNDIEVLEQVSQQQRQEISIRNDLLTKANSYQEQLYQHGQQLTLQVNELASDLHTTVQHLGSCKEQLDYNKQIASNLRVTIEEQSQAFQNSVKQISQQQATSIANMASNQGNQDKQNQEFLSFYQNQVKAIISSIDSYQKQIYVQLSVLQQQSDSTYLSIGNKIQQDSVTQQAQIQQSEQEKARRVLVCLQESEKIDSAIAQQSQGNLEELRNFSTFQESGLKQVDTNITQLQKYLQAAHSGINSQDKELQNRMLNMKQSLESVFENNQQQVKAQMAQIAQNIVQQNQSFVKENVAKMLLKLDSDIGLFQNKTQSVRGQLDQQNNYLQEQQSAMDILQKKTLAEQETSWMGLQDQQQLNRNQIDSIERLNSKNAQEFQQTISKFTQEYNQKSQTASQNLSTQIQQKAEDQNQTLKTSIAPSFVEVSNVGQEYIEKTKKLEKQQVQQLIDFQNNLGLHGQENNQNLQNIQKEIVQLLGKRFNFQANTDAMPKTRNQLPTIQDLHNIAQQHGEYNDRQQEFSDAENDAPMDLCDKQPFKQNKHAKYNNSYSNSGLGLQDNDQVLNQVNGTNHNRFNQSCPILEQRAQ